MKCKHMFYHYFKSCNVPLHFPSILILIYYGWYVNIYMRWRSFALRLKALQRCWECVFLQRRRIHSIEYVYNLFTYRVVVHNIWTQKFTKLNGMYEGIWGSFEYCLPTAIILSCHPFISMRMGNESFKSTSRSAFEIE